MSAVWVISAVGAVAVIVAGHGGTVSGLVVGVVGAILGFGFEYDVGSVLHNALASTLAGIVVGICSAGIYERWRNGLPPGPPRSN